LVLTEFGQIVNTQFRIHDLFSTKIILSFGISSFLIALLISIYPSRIISAFQPANILRGKIGSVSHGKNLFRKVTVGFQFLLATVSIALILTISIQIDYMENKDLGFDTEGVMVIDTRNLESRDALRKSLVQISPIKAVSSSNWFPTNIPNSSVFRIEDLQLDHVFHFYSADDDHLETYGYSMHLGNPTKEELSIESNILINQTAFKLTGWEDLDGRQLGQYSEDGSKEVFNVIGVVKDFHFQGFNRSIQPLIIFSGNKTSRFLSVRLSDENLASTVSQIESTLKKHSSSGIVDFTFLDIEFQRLFEDEKELARISAILTTLIIATSLIGLMGLFSYLIRKKRKEFGIRKVCGSTSFQLILWQIRYFITIGIISAIFAAPVIYYMANQWLNQFAFRFEGIWTICAYSFLTNILIIAISILYSSIKASRLSPVVVLNEE
jgi:putative ABC transport system permease protein